MKSLRTLSLAILLLAGITAAQTFRGGVQGTVTDSTGAAISAAQVTATQVSTGLTRTVQSDNEGNYAFTELPLGEYNLTASKQGFSTHSLRGVQVAVATSQRADIQLTPGQVSEKVEVTAEVPLVDTTGNTIGGTLEAKQIVALPVNGRDFAKLLTLVPGAAGDPNGDTDSPGSFGTFSINGNRGRSNNYLLDGTDMNDGYRNDPAINEPGVFGTPATLLPTDALAEVAILSNMEAEYGRNSGATVNMVTKSGGNQIHGSAFEYFRNNALDARNYFNTKESPQNAFHNNQFGGSLGGPLIKDRTFWFFSYEGWRENGAQPAIASIPTQARVNAYLGAGNTINPVIAKLLARNPWSLALPATGDDATDPASNRTVQVSDAFSNRVDSLILKFDHHLGGADRRDLITGRYFFGDSDQSFPLALGGGTTIPSYNTVTPTRVQVLSLSYTHFFSQNLLGEMRGGWNRFAEGFYPQDRAFDPNSIGLATTANPQDFGLPGIFFGDGTAALGGNNTLPRHRFDTNWQYFTNASYNSGRHNWKFGYEFRRTTINQFLDLTYRGKLSFGTFEDFLAGTPTGGGQTQGDSHRNTHVNNHGFYVQDNFRLSRNLTLNYGMRWDYYGVIHESNGLISRFDPASASLAMAGGKGFGSLYPKDLNNFAPRASIAWDVTGKGRFVVRTGWGLYYDAFSQDAFIGHAPWNTSNPGLVYNGVGPGAILRAGSVASPIASNEPVFTDFGPTTDAWTVSQKIRTPYIQNYNLNLQTQLADRVAWQIGYVGSTGKKLFRFRDINQHDPVTGNFPYAAFNVINQFESSAFSNYNALQTGLNFRAFHGFSSQVSFTWSHAIDNASDVDDYVPNASQPDNSLNPRGDKASSNFDMRKNLQWQFTYALPLGERGFAKGWSIDGVLKVSSGQPYHLVTLDNYNGTNEFMERPDIVGDPFAGTSTPSRLLNLAAFAAPCAWDPAATDPITGTGCIFGTQHFGNERRNMFVGPHYRNFDFSISKETKLRENFSMLLRADFFNLFNHPNFSNPILPAFFANLEYNNSVQPDSSNSGCAGGAGVCRAVGQGFLPTTATPDVAIGNPFVGGGGARDIQLSIRFTF